MWVLLFNLSSKFYKKDYKLNIIVNDLSVSMNFSDNLYDFLVYLMEEVYIDNISDLQEKYKISEKVLQFFHKIGLLICSSDLLGKEAMWFHSIIQNPSITNFSNQVDPNNLDVIYKNIPNYFYNSFDKNNYLKYEKEIQKWTYFIQRTHSSRSLDFGFSSENTNLEKILMILRDLFLLNGNDGLFYWSWWWFYSVYPILVTKTNDIFVYDKYQEVFYHKRSFGVFGDMVKSYLYSEWNDFSQYDFHIILVSSYQGVFNKYGNRGYRYIQMEAWAIWGLLRQMLWTYKIGQLEVQWYNDIKLLELLKTHVQLRTNSIMLLHTLACK